MEHHLEQIIADFHATHLPSLTLRDAVLPSLKGKIDVVIGMRRSGKTWRLFQRMGELLAAGIPKEALLYLNLEDDRLQPLAAERLHLITDVYYRLYPQQKWGECHLFFDEIQAVPGWERYIRRLLDTENVRLYLTGSSSKLLSREIATTLRGRALTTELFPFSFREVLAHQNSATDSERRPTSAQRAELEYRIRRYLTEGGFPEVLGVPAQFQLKILQEYVDVVILRDVLERHGVTNITPLRALIRHLLAAPGGLFSINKFYNDLKSQGISIGKNGLHDDLDHLHDAYLIFPVPIHSHSERTRRVNPRKVYPVDPGLARAFSHRPLPDWGHLLETVVFLQLRRTGATIEYFRSEKGYEVDFLVTHPLGEQRLVQVSSELDNQQTRQRELRALTSAMSELNLKRATLVTLGSDERIETEAGEIEVVPVWWWAIHDLNPATQFLT